MPSNRVAIVSKNVFCWTINPFLFVIFTSVSTIKRITSTWTKWKQELHTLRLKPVAVFSHYSVINHACPDFLITGGMNVNRFSALSTCCKANHLGRWRGVCIQWLTPQISKSHSRCQYSGDLELFGTRYPFNDSICNPALSMFSFRLVTTSRWSFVF